MKKYPEKSMATATATGVATPTIKVLEREEGERRFLFFVTHSTTKEPTAKYLEKMAELEKTAKRTESHYQRLYGSI